jgi:hypothetical protein
MLGERLNGLFDLLRLYIDDADATVAGVRCPDFFFVGREIASGPFTNTDLSYVPVLPCAPRVQNADRVGL